MEEQARIPDRLTTVGLDPRKCATSVGNIKTKRSIRTEVSSTSSGSADRVASMSVAHCGNLTTGGAEVQLRSWSSDSTALRTDGRFSSVPHQNHLHITSTKEQSFTKEARSAPFYAEGVHQSDAGSNASSEEEKPGKLKMVLFWFMVFQSIYAVVIMIFAILAYIELADSTNEVIGILRNWSLQPVNDIQILDKSSTSVACPAGYEEAFQSWSRMSDDISPQLGGKAWRNYEGVNTGCECWNARCVEKTRTRTDQQGNEIEETTCETYSWHYVMNKGSCSGEQVQHGCNQFAPVVPGAVIYYWRSKKICVARAGIPAIDRPVDHALDGCPSDKPYDCSVGSVGAEGKVSRPYCVTTANDCPVYGVYLFDMSAGGSTNSSLPTGWQVAPTAAQSSTTSNFDGNYVLIYTRDRAHAEAFRQTLASQFTQFHSWNKATPVVELGVEPCYDNPHVLGSEEQKCHHSDVRWIEWNRDKARPLYTNALTPAQYSGFSGTAILHNSARQRCNQNGGSGTCVEFEPSTSDTWRLTQMPEVFWNKECVKKGVERKKVKNRRNPVEDIVTFQLVVLVFSILNTVGNLVLTILFFMNYMLEYDLPMFPGEGHEEYQYMEKFRKYVGLVCKLLVLPFVIVAFVVADSVQDFFQEVKDYNCSDPDTNDTIHKLAEGISGVASNNLTAMVMTIIVVLMELCMWYRANRIQKKHDDKIKPKKKEEKPAVAVGPEVIIMDDPGKTDPNGPIIQQPVVSPAGPTEGPMVGTNTGDGDKFCDICAIGSGQRLLKIIIFVEGGEEETQKPCGIQLVAEDENTRVDSSFPARCAGSPESKRQVEVQCQPHEYLTSMKGAFTLHGWPQLCQQLGFQTNLGRFEGSNFLEEDFSSLEAFDLARNNVGGKEAIIGLSGALSEDGIHWLRLHYGPPPKLAVSGNDGTAVIEQPGVGGAAIVVQQPGLVDGGAGAAPGIVAQPGM
ncbi:unnamed protein product [Amoebophrya sp. A120]|nr:unnamed protein product [Amoebophrya sp. A120]|eukprot:GSA120T00024726001.1